MSVAVAKIIAIIILECINKTHLKILVDRKLTLIRSGSSWTDHINTLRIILEQCAVFTYSSSIGIISEVPLTGGALPRSYDSAKCHGLHWEDLEVADTHFSTCQPYTYYLPFSAALLINHIHRSLSFWSPFPSSLHNLLYIVIKKFKIHRKLYSETVHSCQLVKINVRAWNRWLCNTLRKCETLQWGRS